MTYLAKVGELSLKGSNIDEFKNRLAANARRLLKGRSAKVSGNAGRLYIDCDDEEG